MPIMYIIFLAVVVYILVGLACTVGFMKYDGSYARDAYGDPDNFAMGITTIIWPVIILLLAADGLMGLVCRLFKL
nr:MAG TPA: hypothetical protein [Caudoviricetes sp.]